MDMHQKIQIYYLDSKLEIQEVLKALSIGSHRLTELSDLWGSDVFELKNGKIATAFSDGIAVLESSDEFGNFFHDYSNRRYVSNTSAIGDLSEQVRNWLLDTVNYYRKIGFFAEFDNLSDLELATIISSRSQGNIIEIFDPNFDPSDIPGELYLLSWDTSRVWYQDMECDVCEENKTYTYILEGWSRISRGFFIPTHIVETWESFERSIYLEFAFNGDIKKLSLRYEDDWIDLNLLSEINKLISITDYQFVSCDTGGQTLFLMMLNLEERRKLQSERNLPILDE